MKNVTEMNDGNFDAEIAGATPVRVDFSAEWCGPCKLLAPVVDEIAGEFTGRLKVGHVDIDASRTIAARFSIMAVPTLLFLEKHGLFKHIPERLMDGMQHVLILPVGPLAARHGQKQVARVAEDDLQPFHDEDVIEGHRSKGFESWVIHEQDPRPGGGRPAVGPSTPPPRESPPICP